MKDGSSLSERLAAAHGLHERRRPEALATMIAHWRGLKPARIDAGDPDHWPGSLEDLIGFLANSGRAEAIEALGQDLRRRPVDLRVRVLSALGESSGSLWIARSWAGLAPGPGEQAALSEVEAASEKLLVKALDDTEERTGMSGS